MRLAQFQNRILWRLLVLVWLVVLPSVSRGQVERIVVEGSLSKLEKIQKKFGAIESSFVTGRWEAELKKEGEFVAVSTTWAGSRKRIDFDFIKSTRNSVNLRTGVAIVSSTSKIVYYPKNRHCLEFAGLTRNLPDPLEVTPVDLVCRIKGVRFAELFDDEAPKGNVSKFIVIENKNGTSEIIRQHSDTAEFRFLFDRSDLLKNYHCNFINGKQFSHSFAGEFSWGQDKLGVNYPTSVKLWEGGVQDADKLKTKIPILQCKTKFFTSELSSTDQLEISESEMLRGTKYESRDESGRFLKSRIIGGSVERKEFLLDEIAKKVISDKDATVNLGKSDRP